MKLTDGAQPGRLHVGLNRTRTRPRTHDQELDPWSDIDFYHNRDPVVYGRPVVIFTRLATTSKNTKFPNCPVGRLVFFGKPMLSLCIWQYGTTHHMQVFHYQTRTHDRTGQKNPICSPVDIFLPNLNANWMKNHRVYRSRVFNCWPIIGKQNSQSRC